MLEFYWVDDETCNVTLDTFPVITMDHGEHGWDGMVGIRRALLNLAEINSWNVVVWGEEGV